MFTSNLIFLLADNSGNFTDLPLAKIISFLVPIIALFMATNVPETFKNLSKSNIEVFFEHNSSFEQKSTALNTYNTIVFIVLMCLESYAFYNLSVKISTLFLFIFILLFTISAISLWIFSKRKKYGKLFYFIIMVFVFSAIFIGTRMLEIDLNYLIAVLISFYFISRLSARLIYNSANITPRKYHIYKLKNKKEPNSAYLYHHFPVEKTKWIYSHNENIHASKTFYLYDIEKDIYYKLIEAGKKQN